MIFEAAIKNKCFYILLFLPSWMLEKLKEQDQPENRENLFFIVFS